MAEDCHCTCHEAYDEVIADIGDGTNHWCHECWNGLCENG